MNPYDFVADFYDLEHSALTSDTTMYRQFAQSRGSGVLVVGVGTGRVAVPLLQAGFEVWGIDSSVEMLARARDKVEIFGEQVRLVEGDVRALHLGRSFSLVIVPLDTFAMLESQRDQVCALERIRAHLLPEGLLVVDVINPSQLPSPDLDGLVRRRSGWVRGQDCLTAYDAVEVDPAAQTMLMHLTYDQTSPSSFTRRNVDIKVRWVHRFELEALMKLAGLMPSLVYGDYQLSEYGALSPRLIMTASRIEAG